MSWKLRKKYLDLLAREEGYRKKVWGDALTICLTYPNYYRTGMSNLGFQTLYDLLNRNPLWLCERAFLSDPEDDAAVASGSASLFSIESQKPLNAFDLVAFSIPFENDYPHILKILEMARIPLLAQDRRESDPLVIGGGISVTLNPEPLSAFFDLFLLGEGEEVLPECLHVLAECRRRGIPRGEMLLAIQQEVPGAYVPQCYRVTYRYDHHIERMEPLYASIPAKIVKRHVADISLFSTQQAIAARDTELGEMFLTEVSRGCARGCRFCAAGFVYRPARFRSAESLSASFDRGIREGKKIGLLGTAVSDHPELPQLCRSIFSKGGRVAIGSLRLDKLTEEMAQVLKMTGVDTVSLAPEAGSQRLRDVIRKAISETQIMSAAEWLIKYDILNIRLYVMVGLPTETEDDVEAIIELAKRIQHHARQVSDGKKRFRRVTLSVNQFIPKPATPFQWHPLEDIHVVRKRIQRIAAALRRDPTMHVIHDLPKWNYVQALLSLGDRRVGEILMAVHRYGGNWSKALKAVHVNPDFYVYRQKEVREILPWDFIDHGVSKALLLKEYKKALM